MMTNRSSSENDFFSVSLHDIKMYVIQFYHKNNIYYIYDSSWSHTLEEIVLN